MEILDSSGNGSRMGNKYFVFTTAPQDQFNCAAIGDGGVKKCQDPMVTKLGIFVEKKKVF